MGEKRGDLMGLHCGARRGWPDLFVQSATGECQTRVRGTRDVRRGRVELGEHLRRVGREMGERAWLRLCMVYESISRCDSSRVLW